MEPPKRDPKGPVKLSILDRYKDGGLHVMGKLESGTIKLNGSYALMPNRIPIKVQWIFDSQE